MNFADVFSVDDDVSHAYPVDVSIYRVCILVVLSDHDECVVIQYLAELLNAVGWVFSSDLVNKRPL